MRPRSIRDRPSHCVCGQAKAMFRTVSVDAQTTRAQPGLIAADAETHDISILVLDGQFGDALCLSRSE